MAVLSTLSEGAGLEETPELYLKLATECMKQVDGWISGHMSTSLKLNRVQCQYLADRFKMAVRSGEAFAQLNNVWLSTDASDEDDTYASDEDEIQPLEIFKLLLFLGMDVQSFIQRCCKDNWIPSAIVEGNPLEYTSSLGFSLELCTKVFLGDKEFATLPKMIDEHFTQTSLTSIAVAKVVKEKADLDEMRLIEDVNAVIQSSKSSSEERELATFLRERLLSGPAYTISNHSKFSEILLKNLEQLKMLGKGGFGTVHKASWLGFDVAKKAFHGHRLEGMDCISTSFLQEVSVLDGLHHPNIVSLLWYGTSKPQCYIIMELMDGDLQALMQRRMENGGNCASPFNISEALDIMLQVGEGMLFLHERKIVHRDLKSHNILVKCVEAREVNAVFWHVKVADFGMSKTKEYSMTYSDQTQNQGTARWMAPEMIRTGDNGESFRKQKRRFPFKCDIYSFGMVCYEILTGHVPFPNLSPADVKGMVLVGERPELPNECPPRLRTLIETCWSSEPSSRPHFGHICSEIRQMKCEHLMTCWSQMRDMNEREAAGRIGRLKGLRNRNTAGNVEDNGRMLHTLVAKERRKFLKVVRKEVVKGLKRESYVSLIVAVGLPLAAGVCVSVLRPSVRPSEWYMDLNKPAWITGPIFSLIWIMYPIMGLASWLVWADGGFERGISPLVCYFLQLGLILLWSLHFFWDHEIGFALADILAVDFFVMSCMGGFDRVSPRSSGGFLMEIYFGWTFFASFLTFFIYLGNKGYAGERSVMLP